jgi:hypothetical protein
MDIVGVNKSFYNFFNYVLRKKLVKLKTNQILKCLFEIMISLKYQIETNYVAQLKINKTLHDEFEKK